jgi:hypothetical protein
MKHIHKWIYSLISNLDENVDEKTKILVLENCGRACITESFKRRAQKAKKEAKNTTDFLDKLSKVWGHLKIRSKDIYVEYLRCYCPIVSSYPGKPLKSWSKRSWKLPKSWCNCSLGWIKELFESSLEKPVKVILEKSIKQGDKICRFKVYL